MVMVPGTHAHQAFSEGTYFVGWFFLAKGVSSPREAKATVIRFHGNEQSISAIGKSSRIVDDIPQFSGALRLKSRFRLRCCPKLP